MNLVKKQMCVLMRNGNQVWMPEEKARQLGEMLVDNTDRQFISFNGEYFNTASVDQILTTEAMEEYTRRRNNEWKCKKGNWHSRGEECRCSWATTGKYPKPVELNESQLKRIEKIKEKIRENLK